MVHPKDGEIRALLAWETVNCNPKEGSEIQFKIQLNKKPDELMAHK